MDVDNDLVFVPYREFRLDPQKLAAVEREMYEVRAMMAEFGK